jgi:hypothetical protein
LKTQSSEQPFPESILAQTKAQNKFGMKIPITDKCGHRDSKERIKFRKELQKSKKNNLSHSLNMANLL